MSDLKLIEAVKGGNGRAVEALIDSGAEINQEDEQGWTPLNFAAGGGDLGLVKLLVEKGADIFKVGRDQRTPYMIALAAGRLEVARFLRELENSSPQNVPDRVERDYCKAYRLSDLRRFPGWYERMNNWKATDGALDDGKTGAEFDEESIVYLHQNFMVTASMWSNESIIFDQITPEWQKFCHDVLRFRVPDDFDLIAAPGNANGG